MGLFKKEKTETKKDIKLVVRECPKCGSQLGVGFKEGICKACGSSIDYYEVEQVTPKEEKKTSLDKIIGFVERREEVKRQDRLDKERREEERILEEKRKEEAILLEKKKKKEERAKKVKEHFKKYWWIYVIGIILCCIYSEITGSV